MQIIPHEDITFFDDNEVVNELSWYKEPLSTFLSGTIKSIVNQDTVYGGIQLITYPSSLTNDGIVIDTHGEPLMSLESPFNILEVMGTPFSGVYLSNLEYMADDLVEAGIQEFNDVLFSKPNYSELFKEVQVDVLSSAFLLGICNEDSINSGHLYCKSRPIMVKIDDKNYVGLLNNKGDGYDLTLFGFIPLSTIKSLMSRALKFINGDDSEEIIEEFASDKAEIDEYYLYSYHNPLVTSPKAVVKSNFKPENAFSNYNPLIRRYLGMAYYYGGSPFSYGAEIPDGFINGYNNCVIETIGKGRGCDMLCE